MWFEELAGFSERDVDNVADHFQVDGETITSLANGRTMQHGRLATPNLAELRTKAEAATTDSGSLALREVVGDVQQLHVDSANVGALFQVASQFNTLEMPSPATPPEAGIGGYEHDRTQGPACAIACGAGTIFRNYLVPIGEEIGQREDRQINLLIDLSDALGVDIPVRNGYALPSSEQLALACEAIRNASADDRFELMGRLRIGIQWDTEVTLQTARHPPSVDGRQLVTQTYCSALPLAYSPHPPDEWEPLAKLVLDGAYEATLAAAVLNAARTNNSIVYLTLLGGGAFGNPTSWIGAALERSLDLFADKPLDVAIVSYGSSNPELRPLLR